MEYTLESLMAAVGCVKYPRRWTQIFAFAMDRYAETGNLLTDPAYYDRLQETYGCMTKYLSIYKEAARQTAVSDSLSRFLFLLAYALEDKENRKQDISELGPLTAPPGCDPLAYNMITGLAVCSQLAEGYETLTARGFPEPYRRSCLKSAVDCGVNSYMRFHDGQPGYRLLGWAQHYLSGKMCMIDRLEVEFDCTFRGHAKVYEDSSGHQIPLATPFSLHKSGFALGTPHCQDETDSWTPTLEETEASVTGHPYLENGSVSRQRVTLSKPEWRLILSEGDPVIDLHIPERPGEPLTPEIVDRTIREIKAFAHTIHYPYKAFTCHSWLMDPQLKELVGPQFNLVRFSDRFQKLTGKCPGDSVFVFIFKRLNKDFQIQDLPETTRLERAIKNHYLQGKAIYETYAYFTK